MKRKMGSVAVRVDGTEREDRTLDFVASTERLASDGGVIRADGWRFTRYADNPVGLWAHNRTAPPIFKATTWSVRGGELHVRTEWPAAEVYPFADLVFRLFRAGFLRMVSVSWETLEEERPTAAEAQAGVRWVSKVQELLEVSAVPIGADPGALVVDGGRVAEAVAQRALRAEDAALIRTGMPGLDYWERLAVAITEASVPQPPAAPQAPAAPAAPPAPPAPPARQEDLEVALRALQRVQVGLEAPAMDELHAAAHVALRGAVTACWAAADLMAGMAGLEPARRSCLDMADTADLGLRLLWRGSPLATDGLALVTTAALACAEVCEGSGESGKACAAICRLAAQACEAVQPADVSDLPTGEAAAGPSPVRVNCTASVAPPAPVAPVVPASPAPAAGAADGDLLDHLLGLARSYAGL